MARAEDSLVAAVHIRLLFAVRTGAVCWGSWPTSCGCVLDGGREREADDQVEPRGIHRRKATRPDDILSPWLLSGRNVWPVEITEMVQAPWR